MNATTTLPTETQTSELRTSELLTYRCRCGAKQVAAAQATCGECGLKLDPAHDLAPAGWSGTSEARDPGLRPLRLHESRARLAQILALLVGAGFALTFLGLPGVSAESYLQGWLVITICNLVLLVGVTRAIGVRIGPPDLALLRAGVQVQALQLAFSIGCLAVGPDLAFMLLAPMAFLAPALLVALFRWSWLGACSMSVVQCSLFAATLFYLSEATPFF